MKDQRIEITTDNFEPIIKHLSSAIKWLDSDQPESAVMSHLGMHLKSPDALNIQLSIGIIPIGGGGRPTFAFEKPYVADEESYTGMSQDWFTESEVEAIRQGIITAGGEVFESWNGVGLSSVSFNLTRFAGNNVQQLARNYSKHMRQFHFSWPSEVFALYGLAVKPEHWI